MQSEVAYASELGIATHYVHPTSIPDIVRQISEHSAPTLTNLSSLVASYSPPLPADSIAPSSKKSPDGHTPITGEIRTFLDYAFSHDSLSQIYKVVKESAENDQLSAELRQWAGEQKAILDAKSPSGMAVALESFKRAKAAKRLDSTLLNDMAMATAFSVSDQLAMGRFVWLAPSSWSPSPQIPLSAGQEELFFGLSFRFV